MTHCTVTIDNSGRTFTCGSEFVLDAAIAQGVAVPYNCRGGACGTCKAQILEGSVEHGWVMGFAITDEEVAAGRCLTCSCRPTSERLVLRMLNHLSDAASNVIAPAEYRCEVIAAHDLTPTVRRIVLLLPADAAFRFDSGMYVDVALDSMDKVRPYSIATAAHADGSAPGRMLSFLVARHEHGAVSNGLHRGVQVGGTLRIHGPYGTFRLPAKMTGPVLMIAGGTGLAPLLAMAEQLLRDANSGPVELLFSVRSAQEVFLLDELHALASRHDNFRFRTFITRDTHGPVEWQRRRVPEYLAVTKIQAGTRVFVAGSPGFVTACADAMMQTGIAAESITTEAYTPRIET